MISPAQIRMARAALKWGVRDLAREADITPATVTRIETGKAAYNSTVDAIQKAFEVAGIEFIPENGGGVGVRFARPTGNT